MRIYDPTQVFLPTGRRRPESHVVGICDRRLDASVVRRLPADRGVLAGGHALQVREKKVFDLQGRPLQPTIR